jgi:hypothetical protein
MAINMQDVRNKVDALRRTLDSVPNTIIGKLLSANPTIITVFQVVDGIVDVLDTMLDNMAAPASSLPPVANDPAKVFGSKQPTTPQAIAAAAAAAVYPPVRHWDEPAGTTVNTTPAATK